MGRWLEDSLAVLDCVTEASRKQILIGSSMGTWLAILAGINRPERVAGILGIASAPDYTALLKEQIGENEDWSKQLYELGYVDVPTIYDRRGYYRLHEELIVEGVVEEIVFSVPATFGVVVDLRGAQPDLLEEGGESVGSTVSAREQDEDRGRSARRARRAASSQIESLW